jgi:hypothetical protein
LGLMCTHAWLEQRNREKTTLATGEEAIVAEPADYRVAYELFKETCSRTVINLSEAHRKILNAVRALKGDEPTSNGFSQHRIAEKAGVSQSTVSSNKTFLVTSAKLLIETADGLTLAGGIQPALWEEGDVMKGIPTPEEVERWWKERPTPPEGGGGGAHHAHRADHEPETDRNGRVRAKNGDRQGAARHPITIDEARGR